MINKLITFSVRNRMVVLVFTAILILLGWLAFQNLPIDAVPDVTNVQVQINTVVQGYVPEEIERNITFPIESAMSGIAGVTEVRSLTKFGLGQVTVIFEDDTDIFKARQMITERLQVLAGTLPIGVKPELGPVSTGLGEIFFYTVESDHQETGEERIKQLMELRTLQEWEIKPRLLTVKGVAEINTIGGFEKQFHIQPHIETLNRYGLDFGDILEALEKTNQNVGGGYIQQTGEQFLVQVAGLLRSIDDIKSVPIKALENFKTLTVGDVADVRLATELRTGAGIVEGQEGVVGTVFMLMGENSRTVSIRVAEKLKEIQKELPKGIHIKTLYDRSDLVNATLRTVEHNLLTGASLVILILLLLVGNVRAALITAIVIPLSLLFTFLMMKWRGISGNLMSLGALDFGIIVDGAVIVLDNCVRYVHDRTQEFSRSLTREEVRQAVIDATIEIRKAAGFGELIIVIVFVPIFALAGVEGKMFQPMAATFIFAILGALILSFTTVPALASLFLSGKAKDKEPGVMRAIKWLYVPMLNFALKRRQLTIGFSIIAIVLGIFLFSRLGGEFIPKLDEGSITVQFLRPVNISIDQSVALEEISQKIIAGFPEVALVFSRLGTSEIANDPMGPNLTDTFVMLKPYDEWLEVDGHRRTKAELQKAILKRLQESVPGQRIILTQPIEERFNELLEGTKSDVAVKLHGDDMAILVELTKKMAEVIERIPGAGDVEAEIKGTSPMLKIEPKLEVLNRYGVTISEVLESVSIGLGGEEVGSLYEGVKSFPIVVRLNEKARSDLGVIKNIPVGIGVNMTVPLSELATIEFVEGYASISRENSSRRSAVMVNIRGRDTESFVKEAQAAVAKEIKLPSGYYIEWGGNFKNLEEARARLLILTSAILALVLMMIYAAFRNLWQTLLVFLCVPLALVGGVLGLILNGLPFSISSGVGFIALSGIAVLNGVVLVSYFNQLKDEGITGVELVKKGSIIRLRPVLMTALVDIFGFLPMMLSQGIGAEVQKPLASVVIGGIVSSTLLTLVVLPTIYDQITKFASSKRGV